MRMTQGLIPTIKETPSDAEIVSHKLMIRAGMMRKLGAGIYNYLPLGLKVIRKVEQIVREEMNNIGAQEILMPILSPSELWKESGRWDVYGKELMRIKDRHDREFALGPTHEEIITDIARSEIKSYRELPVNLYQIQTKFRDEIRPRFGVMRAREFIMKDAYSFHPSKKSLKDYYRVMYATYTRIFRRCGLNFKAVLADSGAIGGDLTHEFLVLADSGESLLFYCEHDGCGYAATSESAMGVIAPKGYDSLNPQGDIEKIKTPNIKTVEDVADFFGVNSYCLIKTLIYNVDDKNVAVLLRGDREVSDPKLQKYFDTPFVELADEETVKNITGADVGFAGPVNLSIPVYADLSLKEMKVSITGANCTDYHFKNVLPDRDFEVADYIDVAVAKAEDGCPKCSNPLSECRGIEVGQIFQLGEKYSKSLCATYTTKNGDEKNFVMGCYGIGITRTVASAIEQSHDENGIVWPYSIAPYHLTILVMNVNDKEIKDMAEILYTDLTDDGYDVLLDDRDATPGFKFKDADLIGTPLKIILGKSYKKEGLIEIKKRIDGETYKVKKDELKSTLRKIVEDLKKDYNG